MSYQNQDTIVTFDVATVDHKSVEVALNESLRYLRALFDNSLDSILIINDEGRYIDVNPAACAQLGYSREELLKLTFLDLTAPAFREEGWAMWQQFLANGSKTGEYSVCRKDGTVIQVEFRAVANILPGIHISASRDVTERKRVEEELRERAAELAEAQRAAKIGNWVFDLRTNKITWSEELYRIFEIAKSGFDGCHELFLSRVHPDDQPRILRVNAQTRIAGSPFDIEYRIITPTGQVKIIRELGYATKDETGEVIRLFGTAQDITERKSAEEAQREAEQKYREIFENAIEGIFQIRPDGGYISANPALARMLGFNSPEDLIRERSDPLKRRYFDPNRRREYLRQLSEEGFVLDFEYEDYRTDGSIIWFSDNVHAVRDREGTLLYYEGTTQDVTERKRVDQAQRASRQQYESLVHSIDGIVWEADPETFTFTFVSKQAEKILGYPLERWFEGPDFWPDHMHPEDRDRAIAYCVTFTNRREDHEFEYRMIAADGRVVWFSDIVTVQVTDDQSVLLRGVMVDITERKLIEEKLKQSESQLGEAQRLASIGSWNWEIRNNIHTWSEELYHIYGLQPDESELSAETFMELVHPGDRVFFTATIEHALKTREPINSYIRIIRQDGAERIIHSRGNIISDISGIPIRMHGTVQDVTEQKKAENALREAEGKYRDIFENAGEGIFQSTPDGKYIAANPALAHMYGFASSEEFMRTRHDISNQIYVDPTRREEFKRQLKEHGAIRDFEYQAIRKDGSKFWISVNARVVLNEQGAVQYYEGTGQDITDRKRTEEALRESEENYRDLIEHSRELICTHDLDGLILSVNRAAAEVLGHDREDYFGKKNLREILTPEGLEGYEDYMASIRNDGVASGIMLVQTSSGEHRIWEYYNTLRTSGVAAPIVRGMARDITDRKRAEEALRESEERYRELFENAKDATFVHDLSGRYTSVNRAAEKLLGYARDEILGKLVTDFFPPEQMDQNRECSRKLAEDGETAYESEMITKDGRRVAVDIESHLIFENGVAIAVQGTARDITERKAAEEKLKSSTEQLRESEERYRELFENAKDVTYVHDLKGRYLSVNRAAEKLSGYGRAEILGKTFFDFVPPEQIENIRQQLCHKLSDEGETSYESEMITKDGRRVAVEVNSHVILENGVPVAVQGTARDITERKAAEEKLTVNSAQLRALSARLQSAREEEGTRIAREIHDELGSVLTSLKWDLESADKILAGPIDPSQSAALREKLQALMKLSDLAISAIRRIASELRPSVLDDLGLGAAIEWQAQQFERRTGIVCVCDCSLETLEMTEEQSTAVFRILQEALTNVLRHAQATRVDIRIKKQSGNFVLSITDNGKGISEADKSEQQLGILGMRERAHLIGGEIDIKGTEKKGTVVIVRVPISVQDRVLKMTP